MPVVIKSLHLNFTFTWTIFKEKNSMKKPHLAFRVCQIFFAEFLGTMMLLFWGCGAVGQLNSGEPVVTCWVFGNIVFIVIQIIGPITNCHINPAVTVSFFIYGYVSLVLGIVYIIAQMLGAILGYYLLVTMSTKDLYSYGSEVDENFCVNMLNTSIWKGVVLEGFGTAALCFLIGRVCNPLNPKGMQSIAFIFSFAITILAFSLAPYTSASINPARSFGPAVVTGQFKDHWVFWVGPIGGSILSSFVYHIFFLPHAIYVDEDSEINQ